MNLTERAEWMWGMAERAVALLWIPFVLFALGAIFEAAFDVASWSMLSLITVAVGAFFVLGAGIVAFVVGGWVILRRARRSILKQGRVAEAVILDVERRRSPLTKCSMARFRLRVRPPDGATFEADTHRLVSVLDTQWMYRGATVHVKYSPDTLEVSILDGHPATSLDHSGEVEKWSDIREVADSSQSA